MLVRFRQTAAGLQCSLVETRRIDGKVRYEHVASLGSVPASPSVGDRLAFWRRVYEQLAELADRIDAETQGQIISSVHSRVPIVTPNEQRALRVRPPPHKVEKAPPHHREEERPQSEAPTPASGGIAADSPLPFPLNPALPTTENNGVQPAEHVELANEQMMQAERGENVEGGVGRPTTAEEFRTILFTYFTILHSVKVDYFARAPTSHNS
jgi:hypothetical protein